MKALNTITIDGHELVIGTGPAEDFIDPVATNAKIKPMLENSPVQKQITERLTQIKLYAGQIAQAKKAMRKAASESEIRNLSDECKLRESQIKELQSELIPLHRQLSEYRRGLIKTDGVYFKTPAGTTIIDNATAEVIEQKLRDATGKGKRIKADGTEIDDLRGQIFYKKQAGEWLKIEPLKVGDVAPSGSVAFPDLSAEQMAEITAQAEAKRIQGLKSVDREAEKTAAIKSLTSQANSMRGELEITGDKDALKKAQEWLVAEKSKVESKYGA
jgi:hypothetical protein